MPVVHKSAIVPYTSAQMYALVNNIGQYKSFVPWCKDSVVQLQSDDEIQATLTFAAKGMQKSFTTLNRLHPHRMMEIQLVDGPFKQLEGCWRFEERLDNQSEVILDLRFELANKMIAMMFGSVFHQVATKLVGAFVSRAREMYS